MHGLYSENGAAVAAIRDSFPEAIVGNAVDRKRLSGLVVGRKDRLRHLEQIVHPLVQQEREKLSQQYKDEMRKLVVVDIPLLFETGAESTVDATLVVHCSAETQRERTLQRPNMTEQKLEGILQSQLASVEKVKRADFTIETDCELNQTEQQVEELIQKGNLQ